MTLNIRTVDVFAQGYRQPRHRVVFDVSAYLGERHRRLLHRGAHVAAAGGTASVIVSSGPPLIDAAVIPGVNLFVNHPE